MMRRSILDNSKVGLEIETCVYYTKYDEKTFEIPGYEIRDEFFQHLKDCLTSKDLDIVGAYDDDPRYTNWKLVEDGSIRCPNNLPEIRELKAEEKTVFAKKYRYARGQDMLNYAATEIVTSVYDYSSISKMINDISSCLITDNFAYGFNSSQGIHYNISNTLLNQIDEEEVRDQAIGRILELLWYLEPMFVSFLPRYRQEEVYDGKYCNSLERVFGTLDNMESNWREFYIKNEDEHKEVENGIGGLFVPKYTIVNLKNITASSTKDVYFEFRMGSIHIYPALLEAWIKMLSVLVVSGIDEDIYSALKREVEPLSEQIHSSKEKLFKCKNPEEIRGINNEIRVAVSRQEEAFAKILASFDVENTLGVIERLELLGGPGTG